MKRYKIIYEDDSLIVVDKPSGMLVIPTPKNETDTLSNLLNQELDQRGIQANAYPCHRIDKEVSGLVIYAKGKAVQKAMMEKFRFKAVKKTYIAFAQGIIKRPYDIIKSEVYDKHNKKSELAITKYKVLDRKKGFTVAEIEPVTGKKNQIRIQFKELGHPLVGESVYAYRKDFQLRFKRVALHAKEVNFPHPVTKQQLHIVSPLPEDMEKFLALH